MGFNILSMFKSVILAALILFITRCVTLKDIKRTMKFDVLLLISSSFGIGAALDSTGAAQLLSNFLVETGNVFGVIGVYIVLYLLTNTATDFSPIVL